MSWIAITEDIARSAFNSVEDSSARLKFVAAGQSDPLIEVIRQVTMQFREAIRSNPSNRLDPDPTTLPEASLIHACAMIRHRLLTRFGISMDEPRLMEFRSAEAYLKAVAKGEHAVENAFAEESSPQSMPPVGINSRRQTNAWRDQDGI